FLEKVGLLWGVNEISVAQEHFASHIIRQKLEVAIHHLLGKESDEIFILFLPEGELHELGLLYAHFLLKKNGKKVIYLGQNVPSSAVVDTLNITGNQNVQLLCLVITAIPKEELNQMFQVILDKMGEASELSIGGNPEFLNQIALKSDQITIFQSIKGFIDKFNLS
ncbi:MAG: hypothetical protein MRY83_06140, partial [Flavobacteriales bacterium]|nr:hypothetical protein [Flavobacteriales bacterium]